MSINKYLLAVASGVFLALPWYFLNLGFTIFFAFVPLFIIEKQLKRTQQLFFFTGFRYFFIAVFFWLLLSTWWVAELSLNGYFVALVFKSLIYSLFYQLVYYVRQRCSSIISNAFFVFSWVSFEYLLLNSSIGWVWMLLGNSLADMHLFAQWYEYTGVLGGTSWILLINLSFYNLIISKFFKINLGKLIAVVVIPILISIYLYTYRESNKKDKDNIVIFNSSNSPYKTHRSDSLFIDALNLAQNYIDSNTNFLIFPETFISDNIVEKYLDRDYYINLMKKFSKNNHNVSLVMGFKMSQLINKEKDVSELKKECVIYNTLVLVKCDTVKIYKKNKLVFGFENRKYVKHLFNSVFNNNSSLSRGSGIQAGGLSSNVKSYSNQSFIPIICYEVMFGDYLSKFLNKNSRIIVQISEDGWSSYKVSKRQCLQFSRLRAIEVRKDLVRSSNCGHTAYINSLGDIEASLLGSKSGVLCRNLTSNKYTTFYSKNSDFIGIVFVFFTILILINLFVNKKY